MKKETEREWHLDKRVPVALIFGLVMQTAGVVWFAASMESRLSGAEQDIETIDRELTIIRTAAQGQAVQLGRIEENLTGMRRDIGRLIDALTDDSAAP